jgi:hypothetical protein
MASNGAVLTCMGTTPVPSPSPGAAHAAAPSTLNASMPVTSATHSDPGHLGDPQRPVPEAVGAPGQIQHGGGAGADERRGGNPGRAAAGPGRREASWLTGFRASNYPVAARRTWPESDQVPWFRS